MTVINNCIPQNNEYLAQEPKIPASAKKPALFVKHVINKDGLYPDGAAIPGSFAVTVDPKRTGIIHKMIYGIQKILILLKLIKDDHNPYMCHGYIVQETIQVKDKKTGKIIETAPSIIAHSVITGVKSTGGVESTDGVESIKQDYRKEVDVQQIHHWIPNKEAKGAQNIAKLMEIFCRKTSPRYTPSKFKIFNKELNTLPILGSTIKKIEKLWNSYKPFIVRNINPFDLLYPIFGVVPVNIFRKLNRKVIYTEKGPVKARNIPSKEQIGDLSYAMADMMLGNRILNKLSINKAMYCISYLTYTLQAAMLASTLAPEGSSEEEIRTAIKKFISDDNGNELSRKQIKTKIMTILISDTSHPMNRMFWEHKICRKDARFLTSAEFDKLLSKESTNYVPYKPA